MRFNICLAALVATTAFASPAFAQAVTPTPLAKATAEAHGLVLQKLTLTKSTDLDFGTIIASTTAGTVTISADDGSRSSTGGVTEVPTNDGDRALFTGAGAVDQNVLLTLSPPKVLVSTTKSTDLIAVNSMVLDNANLTQRKIGASGIFEVGVGGVFAIAANQPNGFYKADFIVTADYQ